MIFMAKKPYDIVLNLLLLTLVSYLAVDFFYDVVSSRMNQYAALQWVSKPGSPVEPGHALKQVSLSDFEVITTRNLFGSSTQPSERDTKPDDRIKEADIKALEPTSLNITLLGTVSDLSGDGWAVIEENDTRKQGLYHVKEPIKSALIVKILRGKIVLRQDGKDHVLEMEEVAETEKTGPSRAHQSSGSGKTVTVARADVTNSLRNINKLLTQVRIRPHLSHGRPDGFMLSYISRGSLFSKLGLQRGDIIKRLNGKTINTPEDAFSFYKALESGSTLSLDIVRKGTPRTINYTIR